MYYLPWNNLNVVIWECPYLQLNELARLTFICCEWKKKWHLPQFSSACTTPEANRHPQEIMTLGCQKFSSENDNNLGLLPVWNVPQLLPHRALKAVRLQTAVLKFKKKNLKKKKKIDCKNVIHDIKVVTIWEVTQATVRKHNAVKASASNIWSFYLKIRHCFEIIMENAGWRVCLE